MLARFVGEIAAIDMIMIIMMMMTKFEGFRL